MSEIVLGQARRESGKVVVSFLCDDGSTVPMSLQPDFAEAFGSALLSAAQPSLLRRLWCVLVAKMDDQ